MKHKPSSYYVSLAKKNGLRVESGRGSHTKIYPPNGGRPMVIPHERDLCAKTEHTIQKWFRMFGILAVVALIVALLLQITSTGAEAGFRPEPPIRVIAPGDFSLNIVAQNSALDVTTDPGAVSLFGGPFDHGTIGLLAHNYLAGEEFASLGVGDSLVLQYQDMTTVSYVVAEIYRFRAVGDDYRLQFLEDQASGDFYADFEVYDWLYKNPGALVLQTCIAEGQDLSWGLQFWIAWPRYVDQSVTAQRVFLPQTLGQKILEGEEQKVEDQISRTVHFEKTVGGRHRHFRHGERFYRAVVKMGINGIPVRDRILRRELPRARDAAAYGRRFVETWCRFQHPL